MSNYASSRLEDAGRAKLAKTVAAIWGAVGPALMSALTWRSESIRRVFYGELTQQSQFYHTAGGVSPSPGDGKHTLDNQRWPRGSA